MLVLKRKIGESIMIGEGIEIVLLDKEGDSVKIGIRAPKSVRVFRKEIYDEIREANTAAMQMPGFSALLEFFKQNTTKNDDK